MQAMVSDKVRTIYSLCRERQCLVNSSIEKGTSAFAESQRLIVTILTLLFHY